MDQSVGETDGVNRTIVLGHLAFFPYFGGDAIHDRLGDIIVVQHEHFRTILDAQPATDAGVLIYLRFHWSSLERLSQ